MTSHSTALLVILSTLIALSAAESIWTIEDAPDYDCNLANNNDVIGNMNGSPDQCKVACEQNPNCMSFDYDRANKVCYFSNVNCMDAGMTWRWRVGFSFYGRYVLPSVANPNAAVVRSCNSNYWDYANSAYKFWGGSQRTFQCPAGCANQYPDVVPPTSVWGLKVWGVNVYGHDSNMCRAAIHAGKATNAAGGTFTVTWLPGAALGGSLSNRIQTEPYSWWYANYAFEVPNFQPTCSDVHFWVPEGVGLDGRLQNPPVFNTNFDNTIYSGKPPFQAPAMAYCPTGTTVTFSAATPQGDWHYTVTDPNYVPNYGPFTVTSNGEFKYIHVPSKTSPVVWNGYDKFTFTVTCGAVKTCTQTAFINVVRTAASIQNTARESFVPTATYPNGVKCTGSCANKATDKMWLTRQTLPRIWDVQKDQSGNVVKPTLANFNDKATDGLDFEWMSNYAVISTYGAIGSMGVRFPTFEVVEWQPGQDFVPSDFNGVTSNPARKIATASTGFDQNCLQYQGAASTDSGSQVWSFNNNQQDGSLGPLYNTGASWYQKFGGKHSSCDVFTGLQGTVFKACRYAPLLTPRIGESEDYFGIWRLEINNCEYKWQGKFTWNAMRRQKLSDGVKNVWNIAGATNGAYTITAEIYNQAVQPNSWTEPGRGFVETDTKYLLTVVLAADTDFQFSMGIDIFTVDLQQFRYVNDYQGTPEQAFGFNMIVYPTRLNNQQSAPDRRILGWMWTEMKWLAPSAAQCASCNTRGRVTALTATTNLCTNTPSLNVATQMIDEISYTGGITYGNCPRGTGVIVLSKGPQTTDAACSNNDPMIVKYTPGISPAPLTSTTCKTTYQNLTLRGSAPGSGTAVGANGFGFEGRITLTFMLANGEHPHFVIEPKMYVKSISVNGAFSGSSSTCRGSPHWPVADAVGLDLPARVCEEPDARTFGPTDWAAIFFDIKDVDANLVNLKSLYITVGTLSVRFTSDEISGVTSSYYIPAYTYFNYRNLKSSTYNGFDLANPTAPSGVDSPKNTDFGFAFTPGAHNENTKITIYCTLSIQQSTTTKRRFASQAENSSDNAVQESISITQRTGNANSLNSQNVVESNTAATNNMSDAAASSSGSAVVVALAAICAVLLAAVVGLALFIVKRGRSLTKVNSNA